MQITRTAALLALFLAAPAAAFGSGLPVQRFEAFLEKALQARWDVRRAAPVEDLLIESDTGSLHLEKGWVFLQSPIEGLHLSAMFFGEGRFRLEAPIPMERAQVRRFLGTDAVDQPIRQAELKLVSTAYQDLLGSLAPTEEGAQRAREAHEWCDQWVLDEGRDQRSGDSTDEARRRRSEATALATMLYGLLLDRDRPPTILAEFYPPPPEGAAKAVVGMDRLLWDVRPSRIEDVQLHARFDHGHAKPWSLVASFAPSEEYRGRLRHAGRSPALERERSGAIAARRNRLRVDIDPGRGDDTLVTAVLELEVRADLAGFPLEISPTLAARSVRLKGEEVRFLQPRLPGPYGLHSDTIQVFLPEPAPLGKVLELELELTGRLFDGRAGHGFRLRDDDRWYPKPEGETNRPALFDSTFVVPADFAVVANGESIDCRDDEAVAGRACFRYRTTRPIFLSHFRAGRGLRVERASALNEAGTPIEIWAGTTYWAKNASALAAKVQVSLAVYEHWFGPYPYVKLAAAGGSRGVSRGTASLLLLGGGLYRMSNADLDALVAHEAAHQWWGNVVGIRSDRDQWFSEGFSDYAATLHLAAVDRVNGTDRRRDVLAGWHRRLTADDGYIHDVVPLVLANRFDSAENRDGYRSKRQVFMYQKGGFVMHMLRTHARHLTGDKEKGDELFRQAIRSFIETYDGEHPSTLDLQKSLSRSFGTDLSWFFDQWVYGMGIPKLRFSHELTAHANGGTLLRARIVQRQEGDAFRFPVAVYVRAGKGKDSREAHFYQWIDDADATFEVGPLPWRPDEVTLNDDLGVLAIVDEVPWPAAAGR